MILFGGGTSMCALDTCRVRQVDMTPQQMASTGYICHRVFFHHCQINSTTFRHSSPHLINLEAPKLPSQWHQVTRYSSSFLKMYSIPSSTTWTSPPFTGCPEHAAPSLTTHRSKGQYFMIISVIMKLCHGCVSGSPAEGPRWSHGESGHTTFLGASQT